MLLIYQISYRISGSEPWQAADEVVSKEAATDYIQSHSEEWIESGDGSGTSFGLIPNGHYVRLSSGEWAWSPSRAIEHHVRGYEPY